MSVQTQPVATIPCRLITDYYPDKASPTLVDDMKPLKEFVQEGAEIVQKPLENTESWVAYVMNALSTWLVNQPQQPEPQREYNEKELWQDWEWILSKTEEFAIHKRAEEGQRIQNELHHLRTVASVMQFRSYFYNTYVHPFYAQHESDSDWNDAISTVLDSSKVSKIIADVIKSVENQWLKSIHEIFFSTTHSKRWFLFRDSYAEKPYERNVVGSLKELAFSASSGSKTGISDKVMVDILWSLWKTLVEVIRAAIGTDLDPNQMKQLADTVAIVKVPLCELWVQTATKSKGGRAREGQLVEKWKEDDMKKSVQLAAIKARGVDAKWNPTYYSPKVALTESQLDIRMLRNFLEHNLLLSRQ